MTASTESVVARLKLQRPVMHCASSLLHGQRSRQCENRGNGSCRLFSLEEAFGSHRKLSDTKSFQNTVRARPEGRAPDFVRCASPGDSLQTCSRPGCAARTPVQVRNLRAGVLLAGASLSSRRGGARGGVGFGRQHPSSADGPRWASAPLRLAEGGMRRR